MIDGVGEDFDAGRAGGEHDADVLALAPGADGLHVQNVAVEGHDALKFGQTFTFQGNVMNSVNQFSHVNRSFCVLLF